MSKAHTPVNPIQNKLHRHRLFLAYKETIRRLISELKYSYKQAEVESQYAFYLKYGLTKKETAFEIREQINFYFELNN